MNAIHWVMAHPMKLYFGVVGAMVLYQVARQMNAMQWIIAHPMTLFFALAALMVLRVVWLQIRHNRREANRVALDLWCDAPEVERAQFERML